MGLAYFDGTSLFLCILGDQPNQASCRNSLGELLQCLKLDQNQGSLALQSTTLHMCLSQVYMQIAATTALLRERRLGLLLSQQAHRPHHTCTVHRPLTAALLTTHCSSAQVVMRQSFLSLQSLLFWLLLSQNVPFLCRLEVLELYFYCFFSLPLVENLII